jgi:hypothetical protein
VNHRGLCGRVNWCWSWSFFQRAFVSSDFSIDLCLPAPQFIVLPWPGGRVNPDEARHHSFAIQMFARIQFCI